MAQDLGIEMATVEEDRRARVKQMGLIEFYVMILEFLLILLLFFYILPIGFQVTSAVVSVVRNVEQGAQGPGGLSAILSTLRVPLAVMFGWLLSGLGICLLLSQWLKDRRIAVAVTLVLAVLWYSGLVRYIRADLFSPFAYVLQAFGIAPETISKSLAWLIVLTLTVSIPLLLRYWFLRPPEWLLASMLWFFPWFFLTGIMLEYKVGILLLISLLASGAVFLLGLYYTSGFLFPLSGKEHRGKVFNFLRDWGLSNNFPIYVVVDELYEEDKLEERVPGNPFAGGSGLGVRPGGPGFILTDCDHGVVVSDGLKPKGVEGPGVIFTKYADQVVQTVDLRPQLRVFHVEALTKDGIKIRVLAFAPFKIDSRDRQPKLGDALPYNKSAAFKAIHHAQGVEHEGQGQTSERTKRRKWDELPRAIAERLLQNIISEYSFDDLYGPYQPDGDPPRQVISDELCEQLDKELEPLGIQRVGGGISDLEPADPQVYLERARSWQAEWERKITLRQAEGRATWLRAVERARAEAQSDLILDLGRKLEKLSAEKTEFRPEIALNLLLSTLEEMVRHQPALEELVPGETRQALTNIRGALPKQ